MQPSRAAAVDLHGIPVGAGGHFVSFNGRVFEAIEAARQHRQRCGLDHVALVVELPGVFQTGQGGAYDAWRQWDRHRGPIALVAAAILTANRTTRRPGSFTSRRSGSSCSPTARATPVLSTRSTAKCMSVLAARSRTCFWPLSQMDTRRPCGCCPTPGRPVHAATIELSAGPVRRSELSAQIPHRHTTAGHTRLELSRSATCGGCPPWPGICRTRGSPGARVMPIVGGVGVGVWVEPVVRSRARGRTCLTWSAGPSCAGALLVGSDQGAMRRTGLARNTIRVALRSEARRCSCPSGRRSLIRSRRRSASCCAATRGCRASGCVS